MLIYLLKSGVCLAVFYLFYKLLLEREAIHKFKRIYLLSGLLLAFAIPLITFTTIVEIEPVQFTNHNYPEIPFELDTIQDATPINYWPIILWTLYGFGVAVFGLKFLFNLLHIAIRVRRNTKHKVSHFTHVLIKNLATPYTFFNYIFLNKKRYFKHQIPQEVFWHEEAHAKQKHTIDIICIELIQVVFWFNPLLYFIKKDIKLNHEFLADRAVLNKGVSLTVYQEILLTFSSNQTEPQLSNALNYSSIKKRFTLMKTQPSKKAVWIKSLILLPLLVVLIYSFSEQKVEEVEQNILTQKINTNSEINNIDIYINEQNELLVNEVIIGIDSLQKRLNEINPYLSFEDREGILANVYTNENTKKGIVTDITSILRNYGIRKMNIDGSSNITSSDWKILPKPKQKNQVKITPDTYYAGTRLISYKKGIQYKDTIIGLEIIMNKLYEELSDKEKKMFPGVSFVPQPPRKKAPTQKEINQFKKSKLYAIWIDNKSVPNSELDNYQLSAIAYFSGPMTITKSGRSKKFPQPFWCMFYTHQYFEKHKMGEQKVKYSGDKIVSYKTIKKINKKFNELNSNDIKQDKANPQELAEYNKLAKLYNQQPEDKRVVKLKDLNRLEYIFNKMTIKQKGNTEPFPNCPPPPPSQDKATPKEIVEYNKLAKHYNAMSKQNMVVKLKDVERLKFIYNKMNTVQKNDGEPFPNFPPPPPEPPKIIKGKTETGHEIPPPPPPVLSKKMIETNSKELMEAFNKFTVEANLYGAAEKKYRTTKKGLTELENQYKKVMELHLVYSKLAIEEGVLPSPPPPVTPTNPTDLMIKMAKQSALFYYEGKKISSDKAIELTQENKNLHIQVLSEGSSKPIVKLSMK